MFHFCSWKSENNTDNGNVGTILIDLTYAMDCHRQTLFGSEPRPSYHHKYLQNPMASGQKYRIYCTFFCDQRHNKIHIIYVWISFEDLCSHSGSFIGQFLSALIGLFCRNWRKCKHWSKKLTQSSRGILREMTISGSGQNRASCIGNCLYWYVK